MLGIGFASVIIGTEIVELVLKKYGKSPYYSLLYGFYVGQLLAYSYALAEPLMYMLVSVGVYASIVSRWRLATIAFTMAVFTKETALLFVVGYGLWLFAKRDFKHVIPLILVAVVPFAIYEGFLLLWFGQFVPFSSANTFETIPFYGIYYWRHSMANIFKIAYVILIPLAAGAYFCVLDAWKRGFNHVTLYILFNILLMIFLTHAAYDDITAFSRTAIGLNIALISYASVQSGNKILTLIAIWAIPLVLWFVLRMPRLFLNY